MRRAVLLAVLGAVGFCVSARADVSMSWQVTEDDQKTAGMNSHWTPGAWATIVTTGEKDDTARMRIVMRFDKKVIWMIDEKNNTYKEMTFDEIKAMMAQAAAAMAKLAEQMKNMPPAQQEMMKKMMADRMGGGKTEVKVEDGTQTKKIAGYNAHLYLVKTTTGDKTTVAEAWATKDLAFPPEMLKDMASLRELYANLPQMKEQGTMYDEEFLKMGGVPVQWVHKLPDGKTSTMTLTKFDTAAVEKSLFEAPAGATKEKMRMPPMAPGSGGDDDDQPEDGEDEAEE